MNILAFYFLPNISDPVTCYNEGPTNRRMLRLLMKRYRGEWKSWLKTQYSETKIMASGPITSWQIDGETGNGDRLYFGGLKITADDDCSHEIKRCLRKKAEHRRIDAFELWCWRRLLRVHWTARRSNQFILKEIIPEYSLEELMLKVKLQYFGH